MNYKILSLAVLALFVSLSFVSALTASPGSLALSLAQGANRSVSITNTDFNFTSVSISTPLVSGVTLSVNPSSTSALSLGSSTSFAVAVSSVSGAYKVGDKINTVVNVTGSNSSGSMASLSVPVTLSKSYCRTGAAGTNLSISSIDIKNSGTDDTTWQLLDTVKVKVRFENQGDNTIRGVNIELGLFDENGVNKANDLQYISSDEDKVSYGSLKDGDDDTTTFEFRVPADLKAENYRLAVKVYSTTLGQDNACADSSSDLESTIYQSISVETESSKGKLIAFDNLQFSPTEVTCGDSVLLVGTAFNIGDDDQDRVKLTAFNKELKLDQSVESTSGIDQGESIPFSFNFNVPNSASDKTYLIDLYADYDYKSGIYKQRSTSYTSGQIKVIGCGTPSTTNPTTNPTNTVNRGAADISAVLSSKVAAGKPLTVTTTITNKKTSSASFAIEATDYDSWATLTSISERIVSLDAGQSKQVTLEFNVKEDALGENTFTLTAKTSQSLDSKEVVVTIPASSGLNLGGSNMIWVIAGVNLLLLIVIIVVAVRLANR